MRPRWWFWLSLVVVFGLLGCTRAPGPASPSDATSPATTAEAPATATPATTPTPEPYTPQALRLPWDPRDLGWVAYQVTLEVTAEPEAGAEPVLLHQVDYTVVASPTVLNPRTFWMPPEAVGEDFVYAFGTYRLGTSTFAWAYNQNQGQGMWMDGGLDVDWQPLTPEQARWVQQHYLLREIGLWPAAAFAWFPTGQEEDLDGVTATHYRLAPAAEDAWQALSLTWWPDAQGAPRTGQVQWQEGAKAEAVLAADDWLLGLKADLVGQFTAADGTAHPVRLRMRYAVQPLSPDQPVSPNALLLTGRSILPPPVKPLFLEGLEEVVSYLGTPRTGLVWRLSLTGNASASGGDVFQAFQDALPELGYRVEPQEPVAETGMMALARVTDPQGAVWTMALFPEVLQFFQPPGVAGIVLEEDDFLGKATLASVLCGYEGGQPQHEERSCRFAEDLVCAAEDLLAGTCPEEPPGTWWVLLPQALPCFNLYGSLEQDAQGGWQCRFAGDAVCDLPGLAAGICNPGAALAEDLKPGPGQYTLVVEGHLQPGEVRYFRLPHMEKDFTPAWERVDFEGEPNERPVLAMGIQVEADADDVTYILYDGRAQKVRGQGQANLPLVWDWGASNAILELRAGATETDFTLRIVGAPWLGQGNVAFVVEGTLDDSGALYFIRAKPFSTLRAQVTGSGVYLSVWEMPEGTDPMPETPLVPPSQRRSVVTLGYDPVQVLIVVHGPPGAPFTLTTQQLSFGEP